MNYFDDIACLYGMVGRGAGQNPGRPQGSYPGELAGPLESSPSEKVKKNKRNEEIQKNHGNTDLQCISLCKSVRKIFTVHFPL